MSCLFRTITNPLPAQNSPEMAIAFVQQMIQQHKESVEAMEALLKGKHAAVVGPLIVQYFKEFHEERTGQPLVMSASAPES